MVTPGNESHCAASLSYAGVNMVASASTTVPQATALEKGKSAASGRIFSVIIQRIALGFLSLFLVSVVIFGSVSLLPGSFATAILGQSATPETVAAFERQLGLDRPVVERYVKWVSSAAVGDFGNYFSSSPGNPRPVSRLISSRLYNTLFLAFVTALVAVPVSVMLGLVAALFRNTWFDRTLNLSTLTAISLPEFFVAYVLTYFVVMRESFMLTPLGQSLPEWIATPISRMFAFIPNFPILADISPGMPLSQQLYTCFLPAMTLTLVCTAHMMRMTRAAIINLLASPYVEMAKLKGASPWKVIWHHALPNAWAPIANVVAFNLAYLITGVVVVEVVFVYPGVGQLMVDSVKSRDIPVVQACALIFGASYIILNLCADLITIITNPRLMHPR